MSCGSGEALTADLEQGEAEYSGVQVSPTPLPAWGGWGGSVAARMVRGGGEREERSEAERRERLEQRAYRQGAEWRKGAEGGAARIEAQS